MLKDALLRHRKASTLCVVHDAAGKARQAHELVPKRRQGIIQSGILKATLLSDELPKRRHLIETTLGVRPFDWACVVSGRHTWGHHLAVPPECRTEGVPQTWEVDLGSEPWKCRSQGDVTEWCEETKRKQLRRGCVCCDNGGKNVVALPRWLL
jgi:hypothetical protein